MMWKKVLVCVYGDMMKMRYYKKSRMNVKRDFRKSEKMYFLFFKIKLLLLDLKIEKDNGKCPVKL